MNADFEKDIGMTAGETAVDWRRGQRHADDPKTGVDCVSPESLRT